MNIIELVSGIEAEIKVSLSIAVSRTTGESSFPQNTFNILFPCSSQQISKSLQILLLPYFAHLRPRQSLKDNLLIISFDMEKPLVTDIFNFTLDIGISLEQLQINSLAEALESLKMKLECANLNEILPFIGITEVKLGSSKIHISLDSDEIPKEIIAYIHQILSEYLKYLEVLEAIKPLLKQNQILAISYMNEFTLQASLNY